MSKSDADTSDIEVKRRRALYRATHRGTKEMDWYVGRFAEARVPQMDQKALAHFEQLMALPDPEIEGWILNGAERAGGDYGDLVADIRAFHGFKDAANS